MSRPRGFAKWSPRDDTLHLIGQVEEVFDEYRDHLPLTVRQIFYRLVGQYGYEKTEQAYARLCEHLVRARRARLIPFDVIRDDGTIESVPQTFAGVEQFWKGVRDDIEHYSRDRLQTQDVRLELWCEAAGMVPQLRRVAFPYSVPVYSTGGFSSVTVTYEIAQRALESDRPTVFLHVGDFDPSGESIFEAMSRDAWMFILQGEAQGLLSNSHDGDIPDLLLAREEGEPSEAEGPWLFPERVALTAEQVEEHSLPTAPPKRSDTRSRNWRGDTCQLEAMPPDLLAEVVRTALRSHIDLDHYRAEVEAEDADRAALEQVLP